MTRENIERAKQLVDLMNLSDGEKNRLKRAIEHYDNVHEWGYIDRFYYDGKHNRELTKKIEELLKAGK